MPRYGIFVLLIPHNYTAPPGLKRAFIERISNSVNSTFDFSYFDVNMDTFGKLWEKTEISSENQNDVEKKRKLPLEEITEHVKKAKSTQREQKEQEKSTPKRKKVRRFLPKWQIGRPWLSYNVKEVCGAHCVCEA